MKTILYWLGVAAVVGLGIYIATLVKVDPQTLPKVPFAQYESAEALGIATVEYLREELKAAPVVLLGVTPGAVEDLEFVRGFLEAASAAQAGYQLVLIEPKLPLPEVLSINNPVDIKDDRTRFVEGVIKAREEGLRVAVVVPTIYSSRLLKGNPATRLEREHGLDFTSLSVTKFPVTPGQEEVFNPRCIYDNERDPAGTGPLGCVLRQISRKFYRARFEDGKYSGTAEKVGPKDYLVLLNRNAGSR